MLVVCPHCNYSRDVPENRIPDGVSRAQCPRCSNTFTFSKSAGGALTYEKVPPRRPAPGLHRDQVLGREAPAVPRPPDSSPAAPGTETAPAYDAGPGVVSEEATREEREPVEEEWTEPSGEPEPEPEPQAEEAPPSDVENPIPWEDPERPGVLGSLAATVVQALATPSAFFGRVRPEGGLGYPTSFALLLGTFGFLAQFVAWLAINPQSILSLIEAMHVAPRLSSIGIVFLTAAMLPIMVLGVLIELFGTAALLHVSLMVLQGANAPFLSTFKVVAYSGAASILMCIPFLGNLVALVWGVALLIRGTARVHSVSFGKAVLALALPAIILILLGVAYSLTMGLLAGP